MMDGIEFKELFKVAVETLREKTITPLLEADTTYQEDSDNEGIAEMNYLQLDLTEEQRKVCNRLLECRDKQDIEYATHAYIAGLYDVCQGRRDLWLGADDGTFFDCAGAYLNDYERRRLWLGK